VQTAPLQPLQPLAVLLTIKKGLQYVEIPPAFCDREWILNDDGTISLKSKPDLACGNGGQATTLTVDA